MTLTTFQEQFISKSPVTQLATIDQATDQNQWGCLEALLPLYSHLSDMVQEEVIQFSRLALAEYQDDLIKKSIQNQTLSPDLRAALITVLAMIVKIETLAFLVDFYMNPDESKVIEEAIEPVISQQAMLSLPLLLPYLEDPFYYMKTRKLFYAIGHSFIVKWLKQTTLSTLQKQKIEALFEPTQT